MAELDVAGRCCAAEAVGTSLFICTGENINVGVEFQARRTEVTSAVVMNGIKLKWLKSQNWHSHPPMASQRHSLSFTSFP